MPTLENTRIAIIGLLGLALHSLGDYPLRSTALLACAGLLAAFLVPGCHRKVLASDETKSFVPVGSKG
ncbi:MAG: hypothetical protein K0M70_03140 [Arenimonas sp.]|uniref:hypothetical protein n=1 Tax=Arenimonas sp. TaxID=1872635 RepID=UPI0025C13E91|nr:hypothetical protein [Arenimonas sp.]MBW8366838.1 hypothetical protein [Arenimonas sp.]